MEKFSFFFSPCFFLSFKIGLERKRQLVVNWYSWSVTSITPARLLNPVVRFFAVWSTFCAASAIVIIQIRFNLEFRQDLQWWISFFEAWNEISFFLSPAITPLPDLFVASNAVGSVGFGALWRDEWFCQSWSFQFWHVSSARYMHLLCNLKRVACTHHFTFYAKHTTGRCKWDVSV